ncbi:hypothetical protein ACAY19_002308 [Serratia liquefaciens]
MTQTLTTTEELKHLASSDNTNGLTRSLARECLANREAQPVAGECDREVYENGKSACLVVIPKETAEVICRGISAVTGCKVDWHYIGGRVHIKAIAPPAPAVPPEKQHPDVEEYGGDSYYELYIEECHQVDGWNACRAAMLAAAPEGQLTPAQP